LIIICNKNIVDICLSASSLQSSSKSSQDEESKSQFSDCLVGDVLEEINKLSTKVELGFISLSLFWTDLIGCDMED